MAREDSFREAFEDFIEDKLYQGARPATIRVKQALTRLPASGNRLIRWAKLATVDMRTGRVAMASASIATGKETRWIRYATRLRLARELHHRPWLAVTR